MKRPFPRIPIKQIFAGFGLGAAPYIFVFLILKLLASGGSHGPGVGAAMVFAMIGPFFIGAVVAFAVVCQFWASLSLARHGLRAASWSVWGVYLVYALYLAGTNLYVDFRTERAAREDYSGRELELPEGGLRHLLLVEQERGGHMKDRCWRSCLSALQSGAAASIALPQDDDVAQLVTLRLARGQDCHDADIRTERHRKNRWELDRLASKLERRKANFESWKRQIKYSKTFEQDIEVYLAETERLERRVAQLTEQRAEDESTPRIEFSATRKVMQRGHFDQCITYIENDAQDPDARINYGGAFQRPYGPCCGAAEIYARGEGGFIRIARWEAGRGEDKYFAAFTLADVLARVTGGPVEQDLTPHPVKSVEEELARIARLAEDGAFLHFPDGIEPWIKAVFWKELHRQRKAAEDYERTLELSQESRRQLIRIAATGTLKEAKSFLQAFRQLFDEATLDRLSEAVEQ